MIDVLARIEAALADGDAPTLARDLAALAHGDAFEVTAEIDRAEDLALAARLGAHAVRIDAELAMSRDAIRAALVVVGRERPHWLEVLRATIALRAAPLLATDLDVTVVLGSRPGRLHFPASEQIAVEIASRWAPRAATVLAALAARAGRLGLRGARWVAADPELFAAIAGGWLDAARDRGRARLAFVAPAVAEAAELGPVQRTLARLAAEAGIVVAVGACVESVRGVLSIDALERASDFVEIDLDVLAETALAQGRGDAHALRPLLDLALLPLDPFAELDPVVAVLIAAVRRAGRRVTVRGACVLGPHTLARLDELAIGGVCVPAREVARVRVAHARRGVVRTLAVQTTELARLIASAPRTIPGEPPALPAAMRPRDALDELVAEVARGTTTPAAAVRRIPAHVIETLARPILDDRGREPSMIGLGVASGGGVGKIALSPARATALRAAGDPVVLVVREVYADEAAVVPGTAGLVSTRGGRTSHAALVAANCGVPCVIAENLQIASTHISIGTRTLVEGDWLSIDGTTGAIHGARLDLVPGAAPSAVAALMSWADDARRLRVLANADTPEAIAAALAAGAQGIGLVRTENMFLDPVQLEALRVVLLGERDTATLAALQRDGFAARLAAANGAPITFRLLDASLYELLPHDRAGLARLAKVLGLSLDEVARRVDAERPEDPALSLRMSRLALVRPEVEIAQIDALAQAWLATPGAAPLRILVPMVLSGAEAAAFAARIRTRVAAVSATIPLAIGAMMETPRAALDAAAIARAVDFFAWGSNDLTQFTFGIARATFPLVVPYLETDPTESIDLGGVGVLIHAAERLSRAANPALVTGVCGSLASDPRSIRVFHAIGLDYLSVPAAQLPRTRLAAAQQ